MTTNLYETERLVNEYLLFHYGTTEEILPYSASPREALHFPVRVLKDMVDLDQLPPQSHAFDLGCAVGRSSFLLSEHCSQVTGMDFSRAFIEAAQTIARHGRLDYWRTDEGELRTALTARLPSGSMPDRVSFRQGDAMDLPDHLGPFDLVLAANLICRLPEPHRFLERLPNLVKSGSMLILTSPYTWLDEFTPRPQWLGGFQDDHGQPIVTLDTLQSKLGSAFELLRVRDLPLLIREHARKYQWTVAEGSCWRRR